MDKEIRAFQTTIVNDINGAQLPIEVKRLVICNILQELSAKADFVIQSQIEQERNKENGESTQPVTD